MDDNQLSKKNEKVSAAIYLVTNLLSDSEPLKWKLRNTSLCLLDCPRQDLNGKYYSLKSVLEVAFYAGILSPMNHEILRNELEQLISHTKAVLLTDGQELKGEFFSLVAANGTKSPALSIGQAKNRSETEGGTRADIIIQMLKKQSNLGIKEFVKAIKGCSEKTVQRELIDLVKKGVLRREGERRWSTYSLN